MAYLRIRQREHFLFHNTKTWHYYIMKNKLNCILLVDYDNDDNLYHHIVFNEIEIVDRIDTVHNGIEAIAYLQDESINPPDIIFLDLNMPKMNGWEFLEAYNNLSRAQKAKVLIVILTT